MFHIAGEDEIKSGAITDVYFQRTEEILKQKGLDQRVVAEVCMKTPPAVWDWGVVAGIEEAARLMEGLPVDICAMAEGTLFDVGQPVLSIEGSYLSFLKYETSLLGLLCQSSGIATRASRCRKAAGERILTSFGARRMHPVIAPMIERSAFIGGCDSVSVVKAAELIHEKPVGTMPHSLILIIGNTAGAASAFHEIISPDVLRVALIDTFCDEKEEALQVAQKLGPDLFAVRLDTPSSRRGNMRQILEEVRWELDLRGFNHVKLFVSGGIDETAILDLNPLADAYGVGGFISNAPVCDFALDIVEIAGRAVAKRGKKSGRKMALRCPACFQTKVVPAQNSQNAQLGVMQPLGVMQSHSQSRCSCGTPFEPLLTPLIQQGKVVRPLPSPQEIRSFVLRQLDRVSLSI